MKKHLIIIWVFILVLYPGLYIQGNTAKAESARIFEGMNEISNISALIQSYSESFQMPEGIQEKMMGSWEPIVVEGDKVQVCLSEVLFDGYWLYTAAEVSPIDASSTLIMPGAAFPSDPVEGTNEIKERNDHRSFLEAVKADNKQLIAVYIYPREFDTIGEYLLDYFQRTGDASVCLSGAHWESENDEIYVHWLIELYDVNVDTAQYTLIESQEIPSVVPSLGSTQEKTYQIRNNEHLLFDSVTLFKTALTTYYDINWKSSMHGCFALNFFDLNGNAYAKGAPLPSNTLAMDFLPEEIILGYTAATSNKTEVIHGYASK